jgi:hypothetical protein
MLTLKQGFAIATLAACAAGGGWVVYSIVAPKLAAEQGKTETATDGKASAELEGEGAAIVADAVEDYRAQGGRIVERTYVIREQALAAPDAATPLPADRAQRLREHDGFLCGERPVCGAAAGPAADPGDAAVPPIYPARDADAG